MSMSSPASIIILIIIFLILSSLFAALFYLVKDKSNTKRTVNALAIRIGLSLLLFFALWGAYLLGWISPHGLSP